MRCSQSDTRCFLVVSLVVVIGVAVICERGCRAEAEIFFECSNPISPVASDRSDLIRAQCDGEVIQQPLTLRNLMTALEKFQQALRAITVSRSSELGGPTTPAAKMAGYVDSIAFITKAARKFPQPKNPDRKDEYQKMFSDLNIYVTEMQKVVNVSEDSGSKGQMAKFYTRFTGTCKSCHTNFR